MFESFPQAAPMPPHIGPACPYAGVVSGARFALQVGTEAVAARDVVPM